MRIRFSKMHGLGNDFMVVDLVTQHVEIDAGLVRRWADRRTGVGFDQLLTVEPPTSPDADFRYRIFNADGSEAEQCGNGARCFAKFVADHRLSMKPSLSIQTVGGLITTSLRETDLVEVAMGVPTNEPARVPFVCHAPALSHRLSVNGTEVEVTPVSIGNPHAVLFVDDVANAPIATLGPLLEHHPAFPQRTNVEFCEVVDRGFARLRVWERGVGETRACGTGACAAMVAGRLHGRFDTRVKISLPGGKVRIEWPEATSPVVLVGPACLVYEGEILW